MPITWCCWGYSLGLFCSLLSQIVFPLNPPKGLSKAHGLCALFWTFNLFLESSLCQYFRDHLLEELSADVSVLDAQDGVDDVAKVHFSMLFAILIISLELYQSCPRKTYSCDLDTPRRRARPHRKSLPSWITRIAAISSTPMIVKIPEGN